MKREFIYAQHFDKCWEALGLSDEQLSELEKMILERPDVGNLIQGTGGLRKVRFATGNKGKSGSIRVLYVDFEIYKTTSFLFAYPKSELENITDKQKQQFRNLIDSILNGLKQAKG